MAGENLASELRCAVSVNCIPDFKDASRRMWNIHDFYVGYMVIMFWVYWLKASHTKT